MEEQMSIKTFSIICCLGLSSSLLAESALFCNGVQVQTGAECDDAMFLGDQLCLTGDSFEIKNAIKAQEINFNQLQNTAIVYDTLYAMKPNEQFSTYALSFVLVDFEGRKLMKKVIKDCSL